MIDYISRQAAIDAVGNMLRRKFGIGGDLANITLAGLPSADAVPVVKCKDCQHYRTNNTAGYPHCEILKRFVTEEWFCAYGRGKDDE